MERREEPVKEAAESSYDPIIQNG